MNISNILTSITTQSRCHGHTTDWSKAELPDLEQPFASFLLKASDEVDDGDEDVVVNGDGVFLLLMLLPSPKSESHLEL